MRDPIPDGRRHRWAVGQAILFTALFLLLDRGDLGGVGLTEQLLWSVLVFLVNLCVFEVLFWATRGWIYRIDQDEYWTAWRRRYGSGSDARTGRPRRDREHR